VGFFLVASVLSADSVAFTGTLVRKYYQHLIRWDTRKLRPLGRG
jgi:hypothetical protein